MCRNGRVASGSHGTAFVAGEDIAICIADGHI